MLDPLSSAHYSADLKVAFCAKLCVSIHNFINEPQAWMFKNILIMSLPKHTAAWVLDRDCDGIEALKKVKELPIPPIKDDEVLVKIHAASLSS